MENLKEYMVLFYADEESVDIKYFTKEELKSYIKEQKEYYGDTAHFIAPGEEELKMSCDEQYFLIIKGSVVQPKAKKVVVEYDI